MPTSRPICIRQICSQLLAREPNSILDVGVGFGKNGFISREYTDIWHGRVFGNWTTRIDGVEAFPQYISDIQRKIYTNIYIGDATEVINTLPNYDVILCTAVLEHIPKDKAHKLLSTIKEKSKYAMVVLPVKVKPQGPVYGNEYERHIAEWSREELEQYGKVTVVPDEVNDQYMLEM